MHPRSYAETDLGDTISRLLGDMDLSSDARAIDECARLVRRAVVDMVPLRAPGRGGTYHDRDEIELAVSHACHAVSGRRSFGFPSDLCQLLARRARTSPPPMAKLDPIYLEFAGSGIEYAPGRPLAAAYLSRGEVGAITFLSDPSSRRTRGDAMTALLPTDITIQDLLSLDEARTTVNRTDDESVLARTIRQASGSGPMGELPVAALIDERISECSFPVGRWPEAPLAAAFVLTCGAYAMDRDAATRTTDGTEPNIGTTENRRARWISGDDLMVDLH